MSVRIAYLLRGNRGHLLRGVRLVGSAAGAGSVTPWERPGGSAIAPSGADIDQAALWIRDALASTRSAGVLPCLCMDIEGGVCSWMTASGTDTAGLVSMARSGVQSGPSEGEGGAPVGTSPIEFFAADAADSTVQLLEAPAKPGTDITKSNKAEPAASRRVAVLAASDLPARLLVDALDRVGVVVERTATLWHAMVEAWTAPAAAPRADADDVLVQAAPVSCVMLADVESGRLIWAWGRAGELLLGGSMRMRQKLVDEQTQWVLDEADAGRLCGEWMAWSVQLGQGPQRVSCILPEALSESAPIFGRALGEVWPAAPVDIIFEDAPVDATLAALARRIEGTPRVAGATPPTRALTALSARPGRRHRLLYTWAAAGVAALGITLALAGWRMQRIAADAAAASEAWSTQRSDLLQTQFPEALRSPTGPLMALNNEIRRLEDRSKPITNTDPPRPVLEELETLTMVLGHPSYSIEFIELQSGALARPRITASAPDTRRAELLLEGLRRVGGSHISEWTATYRNKSDGGVTGIYTGRWEAPAGAERPGGA